MQALNLMLSGQPISADDALAIGLVDEVVPEQELLAKAKRLALDIASGKVPRRRTLQLNSHMQTSGEVFARAVAALAQAKEDLQRRRLTGQGHYVLLLEAAAAGLAHGPAVGLQKVGEGCSVRRQLPGRSRERGSLSAVDGERVDHAH